MNILKLIRNVILFVLFFGIFSAIFDYSRMVKGQLPIFNMSSYDSYKHIQSFKGIFYNASRLVKVDINEPLEKSSNLNFTVLIKKINISLDKDVSSNAVFKPVRSNSCSNISNLYYADLDKKIYSYCFDGFSIINDSKEDDFFNSLKNDNSIIDKLIDNMTFSGYSNSFLVYRSTNGYSSTDITIYKCNLDNNNDIYIVPSGTSYMSDFCTYKDDDFKFISTIDDQSNDVGSNVNNPEVFYEDNLYYYTFDYPKKDKIFIVSPAVRLTPARSFSLEDVLKFNLLTIDELEEKGLKFNKVSKQ